MHTQTFENTQVSKENLTFEQFWAILMEDREQLKALRESMNETDRRMKETDRQMKETALQMKETDRKISKLGGRFDEMIEHLIAPNIMQKFNALGFEYTSCSQGYKVQEKGNPDIITEVDVLLEDGDIVIAIEVKAKPDKDDVLDHIERMEKLRRAADKRNDNRRYRGAIAGAILSDELRRYILKQGLYLIEQTGDTVQINIPENFNPREW